VPARKRRKLSMAHNRAQRAGGIEVKRVNRSEIPAAVASLKEMHCERWRDRGGGVLRDESVQRFHALALQALDRAGMLDLFLCKRNEKTVAVYYGMRDRNRAYAYLGGFDLDQAFFSPGTILIGFAIEQAIRAGAREFHFLRGNEAYKYEWGAVDRRNTCIVLSCTGA
jgi:CelD/BcsL family acetyltransferase involved in cellulose biosynthesis